MARRDVDLVIKARDQAASVVDSITKALNNFVDAQKNLDNRADKTETTLTSLGAAIGQLDKSLKGLSAGDKLASELQKSTSALDRLETQFRETSTEVSRLDKSLAQTGAQLTRYESKLRKNLEAQEKQKAVVARAKTDQQELTQAYQKAASAQDKLVRRQQQLPALIDKASAAADKAARNFNDLSAQVAGTDKPTAALLDRFARAEKRMNETGQRVTDLRQEFGRIGSNLNAAGAAMTLFGSRADQAGRNLSRQQSILGNMAQSYDRIKASTTAATQRQTQLSAGLNRATGALDRLQTELEQGRQGLDRLSVSSAEATADLQRLAQRGFLTLVKAARDQKRVMLETSQAYDQARTKSTELGRALAQTAKPTADMVRDFERAAAESSRLKTELGAQRQALQQMQQALRNGGRGYEDLRTAQARFLAILDRQNGAMTKAEATARRSSASVRALAAASNAASGSSERLARGQERLARANERAAQSSSRLAVAFREFYGDSRRSLSLLQRIRGEVLSLVAAYGGLYGAITALQQTVTATQQLEAAQARLNVAFDNDVSRVSKELDFIRRTSDRLGVSMGDLATEYSKFNIATKNTSLEGARARKIFIQIAEAARVNRSSTKDLSGVFVALTQIVSKGAVQMEELRQQLGDRLPGAVQIMADGLGVGTDELIKMMEQGQVTEAALIGFADEIERRFGSGLEEALLGINVALGRLQNAAFQAAAAFGSGGFIDALTRFANTLTEVLQSADFKAFAQRASAALGGIVDALGFLAKNFQIVVPALVGLLAFKLTPVVLALGTAFTQTGRAAVTMGSGFAALQARAAAMGVTITRLGYAVRTMRRALLSLAGSTGVGLAFVAISTAIAAWSTQADKATEALTAHQKIVDAVKNAYEAAEGSVTDWAEAVNEVTFTQALANFEQLNAELQKARREATNFLVPASGSQQSREEIRSLILMFEAGGLAAESYKRALEDIANSDPLVDRETILALQNAADTTIELEEAATKAQAAMVLLNRGSSVAAKEAARAILGLTNETDKAATAAEDAAAKTEQWEKATGELRDRIGEAKAALDFLAESDAIQQFLLQSIQAAQTWAQIGEAIRLAGGALASLNAEFAGSIDGLASATTGSEAAAAILRDAEGFRATPYFDVNAFRVGYGSDEITLSDGTVKEVTQGMRVSVADANRDLLRRINQEFLPRARSAVGAANFDVLTPAQQGILTSLTYNYGSLPDSVAAAVRQGMSDSGIAQAIRNLGAGGQTGDVGQGLINRRNREAAIFESGVGQDTLIKQQERLLEEQQRAAEKTAEERRRAAEATAQTIADGQFALEQQDRIIAGKEREAEIEAAIRDAKAANPAITQQELDAIRAQTGALFDKKQLEEEAAERRKAEEATAKRIADGEFEISQQDLLLAGKERQAAIEKAIRDAKAENPEITQKELDLIREQTGALFDKEQREKAIGKAKERHVLAEEKVNQLIEQRDALEAQRQIALQNGDVEKAKLLEEQIAAVNEQLLTAIDNAIAMWEAVGGTAADAAIAKLGQARAEAQNFGQDAQRNYLQWDRVGDLFVNGLANAFDQFAQAVANGENAGEAARKAFLQFASDFLREIAQMILKQAIFNALRGLFGGTSFGATIGVGHTGGLVGSSRVGSGNGTRTVNPAVFASAMRYHTGGIAGLSPGEVPIIAKQGEEILTKEDPRHMLNGGGAKTGVGKSSAPPNVYVMMDGEDMVENIMAGSNSFNRFIRHVKLKKDEINAALGQ